MEPTACGRGAREAEVFVLGVILLLVAGVISLVGSVMLAVAAFKESMLWGFCVLFVPFAAIVYIILHWDDARRGFMVSLASVGVGVVGFAMFFSGAASMASAKLQQQATAFSKHAPAEPVTTTRRASGAMPLPGATAPQAAPARVDTMPGAALQAPPQRLEPQVVETAPAPPENFAHPKLPAVAPPDMGVIAPAALSRHIGESIVISQRDGRRVSGKLLGTSARGLRVQRYLGSGTLTYEISKDDVLEVRSND